jgi:hypothetical protein
MDQSPLLYALIAYPCRGRAKQCIEQKCIAEDFDFIVVEWEETYLEKKFNDHAPSYQSRVTSWS